MNEEENQARAFLRFYVSDNEDEYFDKDYYIDKNIIETILNLVEKQQKEIEELKAITREYEAYECSEDNKIVIASKDYFMNGYFKNFLSDYISKNKIKEKLEEIDNSNTINIKGIFDFLKEISGE